MMKVTINIPDELYEQLGEDHNKVQQQITRRIKAFSRNLEAEDRLLLIEQADRQALEKILSRQLDSAADLIFVVSSLATIKVGQIERHLTTGEAYRIKAYAESMGLPIDQAARELLDPIVEELLMRV